MYIVQSCLVQRNKPTVVFSPEIYLSYIYEHTLLYLVHRVIPVLVCP